MGNTIIYHLEKVKPGKELRIRFYQPTISPSQDTRVGVYDLITGWNIGSSTTNVRQLGSFTIGTKDGNNTITVYNTNFGGKLNELINMTISASAAEETRRLKFGGTIAGSIYNPSDYLGDVNVTSEAIAGESDHIDSGYATWCNDGVDNDLDGPINGTPQTYWDNFFWNDSIDCRDPDCAGAQASSGKYCQYRA
jgi:hypothetical protein